MQRWGTCIPGCEEVRVTGALEGELRVKLKVGYIAKTFRMKTKVTAASAPTYLTFAGKSEDAEISGRLDFKAPSNQMTEVTYHITIRPLSALARTATTMIGNELVEKQANEFAECIKKQLTG